MEDLSDKEQLDAMRTWWAENGNYVLGGIAFGVIILFSWNRWQTSTADAEIEASTLYEEVLAAAGGNDRIALETATGPATALFDEHPSSPYTVHARLAMARLYMDNARDQDAADMLRSILESSADKELAMIARVRLAKVLLYQGRAEEALGLVKDQPQSAFAASYSELMGDAYASMGSYAEAEAAYIVALNDDRQAPTVDLNLIQLKLNDLPAADQVSAAVEEAEAAIDAASPGDETVLPGSEGEGSESEGPESDSPESAGDNMAAPEEAVEQSMTETEMPDSESE